MKKTLIAVVAAATALTAGAAAAQPYRYDDGRYDGRYDRERYDHERYGQERYGRDGWDRNINARQADIQRRIEIGLRRGSLTRNEAAILRSQYADIASLEAQYRRGGLSYDERSHIERRLDKLEARLNQESHDRQYGSGYGDGRWR